MGLISHERIQQGLLVLALLVIPLLIIEQYTTDPLVLTLLWVADALIWLIFLAEYLYDLTKAPNKGAYVRERWFDLAVLVISPPIFVPEGLHAARSLRALRLLRFGRFARVLRLLRVVAFLTRAWKTSAQIMGRHSFGYIMMSALLFVIGGGALFVSVEGRDLTLWDGIWWAVATLTTVGYGDVYPMTTGGRLIAVLVIVTGLGLVASFTANVAAHFVGSEQEKDDQDVLRRLNEIAERLERLERKLGSQAETDKPVP